MDYWPEDAADPAAVLADPSLGYLSRYALGRDYHKVMRSALARVAEAIAARIPHDYRVFVDSGPVLEKALARNAGLGVDRQAHQPHRPRRRIVLLPRRDPHRPAPGPGHARQRALWQLFGLHAGLPDQCHRCALPAGCAALHLVPHHRAARLHPLELRAAIGNRIYGCDDCQLVCPWNKFARTASHPDFRIRHGLDAPRLTELLAWTREDFEQRFEGSAVRRIGHEAFIRNVAVALGNGPADPAAISALNDRCSDDSALIAEHARWAVEQLDARNSEKVR